MTLVATGELARDAQRAGVGLGAFNVIMLEHAQAIVSGAEQCGRPVVLQLSENTVRYHGALAPIAAAMLATATQSSVPVAVHLDHATTTDLIDEAVELGFTSVMYDGSRQPYHDNVHTTATLARRCRAAGITIEAELGEIGGKDGAHAPGVRTDPDEAHDFVEATGVDLLAVAVGTSHAMHEQTATVDTGLVNRLRHAVAVPLVLHGSSGVPDTELPNIVSAGMTKINIATSLNLAMTTAVRKQLAAEPDMADPRRWMQPGRHAVTTRVASLLAKLATNACSSRHQSSPEPPPKERPHP